MTYTHDRTNPDGMQPNVQRAERPSERLERTWHHVACDLGDWGRDWTCHPQWQEMLVRAEDAAIARGEDVEEAARRVFADFDYWRLYLVPGADAFARRMRRLGYSRAIPKAEREGGDR